VGSVASSVYTVITAVISRLNTHCSTDPPQEYALNSTAVIFHLKNTYSVIQYNYTVIISRDHTWTFFGSSYIPPPIPLPTRSIQMLPPSARTVGIPKLQLLLLKAYYGDQ
jgi:hypothetical protein